MSLCFLVCFSLHGMKAQSESDLVYLYTTGSLEHVLMPFYDNGHTASTTFWESTRRLKQTILVLLFFACWQNMQPCIPGALAARLYFLRYGPRLHGSTPSCGTHAMLPFDVIVWVCVFVWQLHCITLSACLLFRCLPGVYKIANSCRPFCDQS